MQMYAVFYELTAMHYIPVVRIAIAILIYPCLYCPQTSGHCCRIQLSSQTHYWNSETEGAEGMEGSLLLIGHVGCGESKRSVALIQSVSIKTRRVLLWMRSSVCCARAHVWRFYAACTFQLYCSTYTHSVEWIARFSNGLLLLIKQSFWKIRS